MFTRNPQQATTVVAVQHGGGSSRLIANIAVGCSLQQGDDLTMPKGNHCRSPSRSPRRRRRAVAREESSVRTGAPDPSEGSTVVSSASHAGRHQPTFDMKPAPRGRTNSIGSDRAMRGLQRQPANCRAMAEFRRLHNAGHGFLGQCGMPSSSASPWNSGNHQHIRRRY